MIRLNHGTVNDILIKLFSGEGYRSLFVSLLSTTMPTSKGRRVRRTADALFYVFQSLDLHRIGLQHRGITDGNPRRRRPKQDGDYEQAGYCQN
jgi:hypothetical protein